MINERKNTLIQAKMGTGDHDPLYPIEYNEAASQPVNIEKLNKIPFQDTK